MIHAVRGAILILLFALLVRALLVEPFTLTTGSMGPRLAGIHRQCNCPVCGLVVVVGAPANGDDAEHYSKSRCPNCGFAELGLDRIPDRPGDFIWVDKNTLEWRAPHRWEAIVFRGPDQKSTPFVKRVVGLPGETVQIREGDVYIDGLLERKRFDAARETSFVIYDGRHPTAGVWKLNKSATVNGSTLNLRGAGGEAVATFQLPTIYAKGPATDYCVFNGAKVPRIEPVHDFRVTFELAVESFSGSLEIELFDGMNTARAVLQTDLQKEGPWICVDDAVETAREPIAMEIGAPARIDFMFYDRRATLCVDESWRSWRDAPATDEREPVRTPLTIRAQNMNAKLNNVIVFRDAHYQSVGRHGVRNAFRLEMDELFTLGDNSVNSDDSRFWPSPGVKLAGIIGKPFMWR